MTRHMLLTALLGIGLAVPAAGDDKNQDVKLSDNDLNLEVAALQVLHSFQFTAEQKKRLQKLAPETAEPQDAARAVAKISAEYRKTLERLRDALLKGDDDEQILNLEQKLDELREKEQPHLDDTIEITDEARKRAPGVLRQLYARQVAGYLVTLGEDIPDPLEILLDALDAARGLKKEEEWKTLRDDVQDQVGRLAAGLDSDKAVGIGNEAVQFLIRVRSIKDEKEFKTSRTALEKEARKIVGDVGPMDVLRNLTENALAELLSNPRLAKVLAARTKQ